MEAKFWIDSWDDGGTKTSFHRPDVHPYIVKHFPAEALRGKRVIVPLCGKTNDLSWFREHADHVIGIELVQKPILQFFAEQELPFTQVAEERYEAEHLTMLNKSVFDLTLADLGRVDLVYDRAALVALPLEMRLAYVAKLNELLPLGAQQLIITLEYEPTMAEPPFSISPAETISYYEGLYQVDHIEAPSLPQHRMVAKFNLKFLKEHAFLLTRVRA